MNLDAQISLAGNVVSAIVGSAITLGMIRRVVRAELRKALHPIRDRVEALEAAKVPNADGEVVTLRSIANAR
jgi:hypothetical protein